MRIYSVDGRQTDNWGEDIEDVAQDLIHVSVFSNIFALKVSDYHPRM